jgi:hypothetical protein
MDLNTINYYNPIITPDQNPASAPAWEHIELTSVAVPSTYSFLAFQTANQGSNSLQKSIIWDVSVLGQYW